MKAKEFIALLFGCAFLLGLLMSRLPGDGDDPRVAYVIMGVGVAGVLGCIAWSVVAKGRRVEPTGFDVIPPTKSGPADNARDGG